MEIDVIAILEHRREGAQSRITSTSSAIFSAMHIFKPRGSVQACRLGELSEGSGSRDGDTTPSSSSVRAVR
jgi:hypothetical protein